MHTHHHRHCHEGYEGGGSGKGPAWFYGYCHESGQMKMMDYPDYMKSMQTTMSSLMNAPAAMAQQLASMMTGAAPAAAAQPARTGREWREHHHDCGCHEHHDCGCDCECECRVRCADAVEYARCGEVRQIPLTFENDTRRERKVTLTMGTFTTECGQQLGWQTTLSDTTFTLPACGRKTVILTVPVQCGSSTSTSASGTNNPASSDAPPNSAAGGAQSAANQVDSCKVAYATLQAEGCRVRPMVIAVAVLPNHCGAHYAECGCGCC